MQVLASDPWTLVIAAFAVPPAIVLVYVLGGRSGLDAAGLLPFALVGVILALGAVAWARTGSIYRLSREGTPVVARVVRRSDDREESVLAAVSGGLRRRVWLRYEFGGGAHELEVRVSNPLMLADFEVDCEVVVLVDPYDPSRAIVPILYVAGWWTPTPPAPPSPPSL